MDEAAFQAFYRRHGRALWSYSLSYGRESGARGRFGAGGVLQGSRRAGRRSSTRPRSAPTCSASPPNLVIDQWRERTRSSRRSTSSRRRSPRRRHRSAAKRDRLVGRSGPIDRHGPDVRRTEAPRERALLWRAHASRVRSTMRSRSRSAPQAEEHPRAAVSRAASAGRTAEEERVGRAGGS